MIGIRGRNSRMTGESTSLPSPQTTRAEWGSFLGFLQKPQLPVRQSADFRIGAIATSRMLALDLTAMGALLIIAGIVMAIGVDIPETALAGMEITPSIIFTVIVIAPVSEELFFRSWLSGRPRYLVAFPIILAAGVLAAILGVKHTGETATTYVGFAMIGGILLTLIMAAILWKRPPMNWFRTIFPAVFWLSTLAFASIHLFNFNESNWVSLLPLVLPQFILGMLLGYLRVNYGLWSAIALHMIHNGLIITIVLIASKATVAS